MEKEPKAVLVLLEDIINTCTELLLISEHDIKRCETNLNKTERDQPNPDLIGGKAFWQNYYSFLENYIQRFKTSYLQSLSSLNNHFIIKPVLSELDKLLEKFKSFIDNHNLDVAKHAFIFECQQLIIELEDFAMNKSEHLITDPKVDLNLDMIEKITYLKELGIIDFIENSQKGQGISANMIATVISRIIGETGGNMSSHI